jgi:hypothetical protein
VQVKRYDEFKWNGSTFRWKQECWPKFTNAHEKARDFYGEVAPVGTAWKATLTIDNMRHDGDVTEGAPAEALDSCRRGMFAKLEDGLGKPKP